MAITINRLTNVIYVPKADLTLIQPSPEVRELDLDWFRMQLKNIEDSEEGMCFSDTHEHFTEVLLAGLTYARIVAILDPYTIEFEDGQYTINCVGANHNVSDVKVANQVSLIVNNAAGLITSAEIEYASFNGGVSIDVINGFVGTLYPIGTHRKPVDNLSDAKIIANVRGFNIFHILGDIEFTNGEIVDGYDIHGEGHSSTITFSGSVSADDTTIRNATAKGVIDGNDMHLYNCHVEDFNGLSGMLIDCQLMGDIVLTGSEDIQFINCVSAVPGTGTPVVDMGGSGRGLGVRAYAGGLKIINLTGPENVSVDFVSGQLKIAATVTAGTIVVRGAGIIAEDFSTGTTIVDSGLTNPDHVSDHVWDETRLGAFTMEDMMIIIQRMLVNKVTKSGNIITIYEENGTTVWKTFDLSSGGRVE